MDRPAEKIATREAEWKILAEAQRKGKNFTVKHFLEFDISKWSIYRYIDRHETRGATNRKKGFEGNYTKMTYIKELQVHKTMTIAVLASEKWPASWMWVRDVLEEYWRSVRSSSGV